METSNQVYYHMWMYIYINIMVVHILDDNNDHGQLYKPPKTLVFLIYGMISEKGRSRTNDGLQDEKTTVDPGISSG